MGIQRASVLYPDNDTTVDSGGGADIRLLSGSVPSGTQDQTATGTHTADNVHRTFDPAGPNTTANNDPLTLQKLGWATRVTDDMTPDDDTNCNAILLSGTSTVNISVAVDQTGGTYVAGTYGPQWEVSLWDYDPVADTGAQIATGTNSATTWNYNPTTGDLGTFKTVSVSVTVASDHEFTEGNILLLQVGLNTQTIPNPSLGTATWIYTLRFTNAGVSNITWAASQGIRQTCDISGTVTGIGTTARQAVSLGLARSVSGIGATSYTKAVAASKSFTVTGVGTVSHTKGVGKSPATVTGVGTVSGRICIPIDEVPTGGGGSPTTTQVVAVLE